LFCGSSSDTDIDCILYQQTSEVGNLSFNYLTTVARIGLAARLILHSKPIFLPARLVNRGAIPLIGIGSASAHGLSTSY
jgi:hypothetical protein